VSPHSGTVVEQPTDAHLVLEYSVGDIGTSRRGARNAAIIRGGVPRALSHVNSRAKKRGPLRRP
jgi:hypothetical protein